MITNSGDPKSAADGLRNITNLSWELSSKNQLVWCNNHSDFISTNKIFAKFATAIAAWSGKPVTFVLAVVLVVVWAVSGPFFGYSETWPLVINTGTTIITFLMVFVLQNPQNRDGRAVQAKLDELILSSHAANKFVGIEKLDAEALRKLSDCLEQQAISLDDKADDTSRKG